MLVAAACDAATQYDGRMGILGTFDTIEGPELPVVKSRLSVAPRIQWDRIEVGDNLGVVGVDGRNEAEIRLPVVVSPAQ